MLFTAEDLRGGIPLNMIPRIYSNEAVNNIDYIPVKTNKRLGYSIVSLEDANQYMISHATDFVTFVENVSYINSIPYNHLAFSVKPSSVYFNHNIKKIYTKLQEQNIPTYIHIDYNTNEYKLIDMICEDCIQNNSTELLDIFREGWFDSAMQGAGEGAAEVGTNFLGSIFNGLIGKSGQALRDSIEKKLDSTVFGKMGMDKTRTEYSWNKDTGQREEKTVVDKFGAMKDKIMQSSIFQKLAKNHPNIAGNIADGAVQIAKDAREALGQGAMDFLQNAIGIDPNKPISVENLMNAITGAINKFRGRAAGNNQGIIQSIINKLIQIKNQLLGSRR